MHDHQQGAQVPLELIIAAVEEQRDAALTNAAQMRALARHYQAENERLREENEKLRGDAVTTLAAGTAAAGNAAPGPYA